MAKLKVKQVKKFICETCHGNGYVRVATLTGNPSDDFRDNSQIHQCWVCDSEGEIYEERTDLINDSHVSNKLH